MTPDTNGMEYREGKTLEVLQESLDWAWILDAFAWHRRTKMCSRSSVGRTSSLTRCHDSLARHSTVLV